MIQALLIPLTLASFQVFNLWGLMTDAAGSWNGVCGVAVVCGTYFLLVLGPRSLASEGGALWIATTWPRGLQDLLKAKARLWWFLSAYGIVGLAAWGIMSTFLENRGVNGRMIWRWERNEAAPGGMVLYAGAVFTAAVLAGVAALYLAALRVFPLTAEFMGEFDTMAPKDGGQIVYDIHHGYRCFWSVWDAAGFTRKAGD